MIQYGNIVQQKERRLSALPDVGSYILYIYTTLTFLVLQGSPHIYDIIRLGLMEGDVRNVLTTS
jgi:hypothetical protein